MEEPAGDGIVVGDGTPPFTTQRGRVVKPLANMTLDTVTQPTEETKKRTRSATQEKPNGGQKSQATKNKNGDTIDDNDGLAMLRKALEMLEDSHEEIRWLKAALKAQVERARTQQDMISELSQKMEKDRKQMTEELKQVREQLEAITTNATSAAKAPLFTYADAARASLPPQLTKNNMTLPNASHAEGHTNRLA